MPTKKQSQPSKARKPRKKKYGSEKVKASPPNSLATLKLQTLGKKAKRYGIDIAESLAEATLERALEGASTVTLTVSDPDYALVNCPIFDMDVNGRIDPLEIQLDGLTFRLVKFSPQYGAQGNVLTLTFEDRNVNILRHAKGKAISMSRAKATRAQFIEKLVTGVTDYDIPFVCPEKNVVQEIADPEPS